MHAEILPELAPEVTEPEVQAVEDDSRSEYVRSRAISEPKCLLPHSIRRGDGFGPAVDLDQHRGKLLVVTLGINEVVERTGLTISVWGSADQIDWAAKPLAILRQRQYCGVYSALLNLSQTPEVRFLRVEWSMNRWGKGHRTAQFGFQVFVEESGARVSSSACA
jgi:hypothetical protein